MDKCPVDHETRSKWLEANPGAAHPFHPSSDIAGPSRPSTTTSKLPDPALSHNRVVSSIPRASTSFPSPEGSVPHTSPTETVGPPAAAAVPAHSASGEQVDGKWVYPSEHQFFQAMLRKNHNPKVADMRTIVPIHNAVNEKAWEQVLAWEGAKGSGCGGPRLISFVGRPKDMTPKAWIKSICGYVCAVPPTTVS